MKKIFLLYTIVYLQCIFLLAANQNNGFNKPDWPLEKLSWDIDKAYPGVEYNYRLAIRGGEYPYTFSLIKCPSGMKINSSTGEITWTPALTDTSSKNQIIAHIKDLKNNILKDTFVVDVTKKNFYFVANNGSNSNNGSEATPWATMAYAATTADSSSYVYVKKGKYSESEFEITAKNCGRFMAYPGDTVFVNSTAAGKFTISINAGSKRLFQGFNFDGNGLRWLFSVGGYAKNLIWRKNIMHNNGSSDRQNPAFIFFWDGGSDPIKGQGGYDNVVIQDNIFYDLRDPVNNHCASVTCFDVKNMLYEDNIAHDIDGSGVNDKDMGYMNTIRNNVFYDCNAGIGLLSQGGQSGVEVNYNIAYNCNNKPITIGLQNGYVNNIFIHHNTFIGSVKFTDYVIAEDNSYNINIYNNIIGNGSEYPYSLKAYPNGFESKVMIDSNIVFGKADLTKIAGYSYGITPCNWKQWQDSGKDVNSKAMQLQFDSNNIPILPDSLKIYGSYGNDYSKVTDVKMSENDNFNKETYSLSQNYPNPFNPSTMINYSLPAGRQELPMNSNVSLKIFDILGREVTTLVNEHKPAGNYTVEWNGTNSAGQQVGSGIYFYQLKTSNGFMETKKMTLLR